MWFIILITIICIPILEIIVFIEVGDRIGLFNTIFMILFTAIVGFSLMRSQGLSLLIDAQANLKSNNFPVKVVYDGLCIVFAGILLFIPGFVTDTLGFLFFLPSFRKYIKVLGYRFFKNHNQMPFSSNTPYDNPVNKTIDADFQDITNYKKDSSNKHVRNKLRDQ